mgnify:CR=1 FL=1
MYRVTYARDSLDNNPTVKEFDLLYTTLFIETSTFLVTEKTNYQDNVFISPITFTNSLTINTSFFDKVSNRVKVGSNVFFCRFVRDQLTLKDNRLYPKIYKYNFLEIALFNFK